MIQTVLNEELLKCLGAHEEVTFRTPEEVMNGIKPTRIIFYTIQMHSGNQTMKTFV